MTRQIAQRGFEMALCLGGPASAPGGREVGRSGVGSMGNDWVCPASVARKSRVLTCTSRNAHFLHIHATATGNVTRRGAGPRRPRPRAPNYAYARPVSGVPPTPSEVGVA